MSWDDAFARRDATSFLSLIADDYLVTGVNGETKDKSTVLEAMASSDAKLKPHKRDDIQVRLFGDIAIVTGRVIWRTRNALHGCPSGDCHARYLKVYAKRDGVWKVIVAQATRIAAQQPQKQLLPEAGIPI